MFNIQFENIQSIELENTFANLRSPRTRCSKNIDAGNIEENPIVIVPSYWFHKQTTNYCHGKFVKKAKVLPRRYACIKLHVITKKYHQNMAAKQIEWRKQMRGYLGKQNVAKQVE